MRITPDTNFLLRTIFNDTPGRAQAAQIILEQAKLIAIPVAVFCELV